MLCKLFSAISLGLYKDVAWELFVEAAKRHRLHAFYALISAILTFLAAFVLNLFSRIKGKRGITFTILFMLPIAWMVRLWVDIVLIGEKYIYGSA